LKGAQSSYVVHRQDSTGRVEPRSLSNISRDRGVLHIARFIDNIEQTTKKLKRDRMMIKAPRYLLGKDYLERPLPGPVARLCLLLSADMVFSRKHTDESLCECGEPPRTSSNLVVLHLESIANYAL
jgi:hypothetical protein